MRRRPATDELIYAWHPNSFAMRSMRSATVSRLHLQVDATDDIKNWSDDRIWSELSTRMAIDGAPLNQGPLISKGILPMRSFVSTQCAAGDSSSPATPHTSFHRPAQRG